MKHAFLGNERNFVRANFHSRGLWKAMPTVRSVAKTVPDPSAIVRIGQILKDLKYERNAPQGFASIPEFEGLDYIGYIIEKERLDKGSGQWLRIDEYRVLGSKAASFKDSRVAYGECYRYRMRSVVKLTKGIVKESFQKFDLQEDIRQLESEMVQNALQAQQEVIASVDNIVNAGLSSKVSVASQPTTFDVLSNMSVQADSEQTTVVSVPVTNTVTTLKSMRVGSQAMASVDFLQGTMSAEALQKMVVESVSNFIDYKVEFFSYYYASEPSRWNYVCIREKIPPPPPQAIKIIPNTPERKISISWLAPANSQRDIKFFKLYKRERIGRSWRLVKIFARNQNLHEDTAVRLNRSYIYALTSVDAHGIESALSIQTQARLNPQFLLEGVEKPLKWISGSGARPDRDFSKVFKRFFEPELPIVAKENVTLGPQRDFRATQKKLLVRVKSLDIHESKEFVVTLQNELRQPPDSV